MAAATVLTMASLTPLALLDEQPVDAVVTVRATLRALQLKRNAKGEQWGSLQLEQSGSVATVLVFVRTFAAIQPAVLRPNVELEFDARVLRRMDGTTQLTPITTPEPAL